jgi:tRNA G10  N-methylase Trm11
MTQSVMILGRQPKLGLAELESLYGSDKVRPVGEQAALVNVDPCLLAFDRLGGSVKFCKLLTILDHTDWKQIEKFLVQVGPGHAATMPEGKMQLGLSVIGMGVGLKQLEATGLTLKKAIRKSGRSVRLVPNKAPELNSAQVIHNHLTGPTGWELVFIRDGDKTMIVQTVKVQDIEAYTRRDRERPMRDTKVGMLPPKLAQIIINLASGPLSEETLTNICDIPADQEIQRPRLDQTILDPFCGTGVILQEAALMGYDVSGTDLEPRMIDYSQKNMAWLAHQQRLAAVCCELEVGDATDYQWKKPVDFVAAETYLGRPFTRLPDQDTLNQAMSDTNHIIKKFLKNIGSQIKPGTRLALAIPAWQVRPNQFKQLPLVDSLSDLGYNSVSFEHAGTEDLLYYRPDQVVARRLIVITKE